MLYLNFLPGQDFLAHIQECVRSFYIIQHYSNELIFLLQNLVIATCGIIASRFGKAGLTSYIVMCWTVANFFVLKEVTLFGQDVITSDGFAIGVNSSLLLLTTYYGDKFARRAIGICAFLLIFFLVMTQIHMWYIPNVHDMFNPHYGALLSCLPRIIATSLFVSVTSTHVNLLLFRFFSYALSFLPSSLIQACALMVSQVFDTTLFAFLALYGTVSSITSIIIFSCCIKFVAIGLNVVIISFVTRHLSKPYDVA